MDKSYNVKLWNGKVDMPEGGLHMLHTHIFLVCTLLYLKYSFSY